MKPQIPNKRSPNETNFKETSKRLIFIQAAYKKGIEKGGNVRNKIRQAVLHWKACSN